MRKHLQKLLSLTTLLILANLLYAGNDPKTKKVEKKDVNLKASTVEWKGKKIGGEHFGNVPLNKAHLLFDGNKLSGGSFVIDMTNITCTDLTNDEYNQKLVGHLKSDDFFSVANYPTAKFDITKVNHKGGENYEITGDLTIKGETHPVTFPATVKNSKGNVNAMAELTFDRSKYNIKYGSKTFFESIGDKMIYDDVELKVNLVSSTSVASK